MCPVWEERLPMRLTPKMRVALGAIRASRVAWVSTESDLLDSETFVHWRTAEALERRGLIRIDDMGIFIVEDTE